MKIDVLTLFPEMFQGPINESMLKRAREKGKVDIRLHDIREYTFDPHQTADDKPYGGGSGMVMKIEPLMLALEDVVEPHSHVVILSPKGEKFTQETAKQLAQYESLVLVCGHYEGIDERLLELIPCQPISIGDYVLTNGELPAMVLMDSVVRLLPGVLGNADSLKSESFEENLLDYPQYTRPAEFRGKKVPEILLSGDHQKISDWRQEKRIEMTKKYRPDLLKRSKDVRK